MNNVKDCSRSSADKEQKSVDSVARWEGYLRMLIVLERRCLDLSEAVEHTLMESGKSLQKDAPDMCHEKISQELQELEERKSKEAQELSGKVNRARMPQGKELPVAEGDFTIATGSSSFWPSLAHDVDEEGSTPSRRSEGSFSVAASGSVNPEGKADRWSTQTVKIKESEGVSPQAISGGGFPMCEVEEQKAALVEVQGPKRRVVRAGSEETQDHVHERLAHEDSLRKKQMRLASYRVRCVNLDEQYIGMTTDAVKRPW